MLDTPQSLLELLQLATALTFLFGSLFLLLSVMFFRRSRRDSYWRLRRQAGQQGLRYIVLAVIILGISAALCMISATIAFVEHERDKEAAASPIPSEMPTLEIVIPTFEGTPAALDVPLAPTIETPTLEATQEALPTVPQATPSLAATSISSLPSDAALEIKGIDDVISDSWQSIQAENSFPVGTQRLYFFFNYQNMPQGFVWGQVLLKDGTILQQQSQRWGITPEQGETFFFFGDEIGFAAGSYEVRLTLGAEGVVLASTLFTIQ